MALVIGLQSFDANDGKTLHGLIATRARQPHPTGAPRYTYRVYGRHSAMAFVMMTNVMTMTTVSLKRAALPVSGQISADLLRFNDRGCHRRHKHHQKRHHHRERSSWFRT
jgi:phosphoribosylcarboxyaminoimidazole (NCAIR) mutase